MKLHALLVSTVLVCASSVAYADSVRGVPVTGIASTTQAVPTCPTLEGQVCYNAATGSIGFFIPMSSSFDGVYGVTAVPGGTAGTVADTGDGLSNALTMYLLFSPVSLPVQSASLSFVFTDLDLAGANDPYQFFETVQFFAADGTPLSCQITSTSQTCGEGYLAFGIFANTTYQTIYFPNVTSVVQNPFYVKLNFGSDWTQDGKNTSESLTATLSTTAFPQSSVPTPVPEPTSLLLLGSGLMGAAWRVRRKLRG